MKLSWTSVGLSLGHLALISPYLDTLVHCTLRRLRGKHWQVDANGFCAQGSLGYWSTMHVHTWPLKTWLIPPHSHLWWISFFSLLCIKKSRLGLLLSWETLITFCNLVHLVFFVSSALWFKNTVSFWLIYLTLIITVRTIESCDFLHYSRKGVFICSFRFWADSKSLYKSSYHYLGAFKKLEARKLEIT